MKSTNYTKKVLDHFQNPRNVGTLDGDNIASGRVGNPVCGDIMEIYIDVNEKEDTIKDIKFQTFGCGSAVATSSMITEMAIGMKLDDAMKITRKDVAENLEGLPPAKMHCSNLAADALQEAIRNYRKEKGIEMPEEVHPIDVDSDPHAHTHSHKPIDKKPSGQSNAIKNEISYLGNGVYYNVKDPNEFKDQRILVLYRGQISVDIALDLTKVTGRVVLATEYSDLSNILPEMHSKIKRSDVKMLGDSQLLEIMGEGDVEKVKMRDLDEDNTYELFIDVVIIPEKVELPNSCDLPDE